MILEFKLDEQDFLDFQLFTASQSGSIRKRMLNGWIFPTIVSGIAAIYFYFSHSIVMTAYFGVIVIIYGLFFPEYFRWRYKRYYKIHIRENFYNRFGETEHLEIKDNVISSQNMTGEGTINLSEIDRVDETDKYFFVKIRIGASLIIPKHKIPNADDVRNKFESLGFAVNGIISNKWKY